MMLAVASGKGGTGKTTLSVALALSVAQSVRLIDCDVEEPNGHLFLNLAHLHTQDVTVPVPVVDEKKCTACGACAQICQFNAIVSLGIEAMVFPELCHSCGGCAKVCPTGAITETPVTIGSIMTGTQGHVFYAQGRLRIGHAMSPPVIRAVKRFADQEALTILDCPPGTSCPMITAVRGADFVLLVTEPTPFGLHDLTLAVETMRELGLAFAVAINRSDAGDDRVEQYCRRQQIPVLIRIPDDRRVAEACSRGETLISAMPELRAVLAGLLSRIEQRREGGRP